MAKAHSALNIDLGVPLFITPWLESASALAFHLCLYYLKSVSAHRGSRSAQKQATQYAFLCFLACFVSCFFLGARKGCKLWMGLSITTLRVSCANGSHL